MAYNPDEVFQTPIRNPPRLRTPQKRALDSPSFCIPPSPMMQQLGYGTGVSIYLLRRPTAPSSSGVQSPWAVKKVNRNYANTGMATSRIVWEAQILSRLSHPNLVGYRGLLRTATGSLTTTGEQKSGVALALQQGGQSLMSLLEHRSEAGLGPLLPASILRVAYEVSKGLRYLHSQRVLHGDVKSSNVLVNQDFSQVMLCDLGTALELDENLRPLDPDAEYIGTDCWSPWEVLDNGEVSDRADIYAFGMLLYEMIALTVPHAGTADDISFCDGSLCDLMESDSFMNQLGRRPDIPQGLIDSSYNQVIELYVLCSSEQSKERPSAARLVDLFETFVFPEN